jgi:anti-sigma regulatory factor (Ser/Thr protein kinase)
VEVMRVLGAGPQAPGEARRSLHALAGAISPRRLEDVRLVVSELVTNSVVHAGLTRGDPITVSVHVFPYRVRVEVVDYGTGFPHGPPDPDHHGWGLPIVERLADRWGTECLTQTKVWAEFSLPG